MCDRVYICPSVPPKLRIGNTVGFLKGKSAVILRRTSRDRFVSLGSRILRRYGRPRRRNDRPVYPPSGNSGIGPSRTGFEMTSTTPQLADFSPPSGGCLMPRPPGVDPYSTAIPFNNPAFPFTIDLTPFLHVHSHNLYYGCPGLIYPSFSSL